MNLYQTPRPFKKLGFLLCGLLTLNASAQVARLYTNQHGLKTSNCHSIDIDSRGFAWISGYSSSLGVFDGTRFQYLPAVKDGKPLFQIAYGVKETADNHYWVASSQGLYLLNAHDMKFERILLQADEDSVYGYAINAIIDYPQKDRKLVTTDGFSTFVLNTANPKDIKVDRRLSNLLNDAAQDYFVSHPLIDRNGRLWASTQNKPLICINLNGKVEQYPFDYTPAASNIIRHSRVTALLELSDGLLIGTSHGLLMYDPQQNLIDELSAQTENLFISSIIKTHDRRILVGTDGRGIWELTHRDGAYQLVPLFGPMADFDISYGKVMDMKEDDKGNIITIFLQKGLVVIPPQSDSFHYHAISPSANGKNANCITSMATDQEGNYWIATDGCGVFTTNGMRLATARPVCDGLNSLLIQDIKVDKHGTVWVGSFGGGVQYLENGQWTHRGLDTLQQQAVMTMHYNPKNDQLFVGTNGNGIFRIDVSQRSASRMDLPFSYNPWISCLLQDSNQTLWVATSSGLVYYNARSGKHGELKLNGKRINNANDLLQDGDNILIAIDEGLIIYNVKTREQQLIGQAEGISTVPVRSIVTTPKHIWISTQKDIASIDRKTHTVRNYSSFNGYQIGEFHRNSHVQPGHDYILFGGDNGILCFSPELIANRRYDLRNVFFTSLSTPLHTEKLDASIFFAHEIELTHENSSFTISFAATELGDPQRIHYDYILEGHEEQWHRDTPTPLASYSSLSAGTYTLRVRAYLEDTPAEYAENTLCIRVNAAWYATTWAWAIYLVLACILAYVLALQVRQRKQQKEELRASAENTRMKEAKLQLFTSITHELRSPLTMIESPLKQLIAEDTNPEHQSLYSIMQRNCDRLLGIVKQITDIRKIDSGQMPLHLEEHDYVPYANAVYEQFKGVATVKNISFVVEHSEEELPMLMDTTHFEKIITNLLSNAFKFTPAGGKVIVRSGIVAGNIELRFYNSGSHFDAQDLQHLWERFYQGSAGNDAAGSGIGLNLVHELVRLHHGTIEAKNVEPDGVEFTLHFPYLNTAKATSDNGHITLLLVDDDAETVQYLRSQLERDYNVLHAFSGNTAWQQVLTRRPDVVITDYRMPDGDGMQLCQNIKGNPETDNIPVIMLTGEGDDSLRLHSLNIQVDHYLEKPVDLMMLRSAISQVLRVRENLRNRVRRTELGQQLPQPTMENAEERLFTKINESIRHHLDNSDFSVRQLSEEVGISRVHLNRKMKERYGVSPNIFIRTFRLKQAAYLLVNNKVNVSEVAYKVGFSSHSYFTTAFHEHFGMSPKDFIAFYSEEKNSDALQKLLE